jgi:uncharacterized membrane protein YsdA (DUF1294 family)/cold shock CspA family protein
MVDWKDERGYGFAVQDGKREKAFVHISAFPRHARRPVDGDLITYDLATDDKGRPRAVRIQFVNAGAGLSGLFKSITFSTIVVVAFSLFLVVAGFLGRLHFAVAGIYFLVSLLTFCLYALDKSAAQSNHRRISEKTLLLLGLACGWPGALLAHDKLHHKSKKISFLVIMWATVLVNCIALGWLYSMN